jgi:predicted glycogen debranching enzyme
MSRRKTETAASLTLGPETTRTVERAVAHEWLATNARGDIACGTVAGPNTRRAHGLFTMAGGPGRAPMLLLAEIDVVLVVDGTRHALSCHQFADSRHPDGFKRCSGFAAYPFPEWRYDVDGVTLTQRLLMPHDARLALVTWDCDAPPGRALRLEVRPLLAFREADALTHANDAADLRLHERDGRCSLRPYHGCPELFLHHNAAATRPAPCWYYRLRHAWDIALGRPADEDLFTPGVFVFHLAPGAAATLAAGLDTTPPDAQALERAERARVEALALPGSPEAPPARCLARAASQFTIQGEDGRAYLLTALPEAVSDVRDVLIALPGLLLCTRRLEAAREVLDFAGRRVRVPADDAPLDDTPLWFLRAAELYVDHARDWRFLREGLAPAALEIAARYLEGDPSRGFAMGPDGLLVSTNPGLALTWMNARVCGWPVTPRAGKPVEVNALWHRALGRLARWARRLGDDTARARFARLHELAGRSFRLRFQKERAHGLYDVVDRPRGGNDACVRPNQLFAVALSPELLDRRQARGIVRLVEERLLTPFGLRTLSPDDPAYRPRYGGDAPDRAAARHQGSVHPWLLGVYADAVFRFRGRTDRVFAQVASAVGRLLEDHLSRACLGQVSALFEGAAPHRPRGPLAEARAVGELTRVYAEVHGRLW